MIGTKGKEPDQPLQKFPMWVYLLGLFFLLVIVDGALRKWVLPSQETILFLLKDVVLWGGYGLYALKRNPLELPRPLYSTWAPILLGAYVIVVLLQAFNLRQPSLFVSALGLKAHLAYLPLVILVPALLVQVTERQMLRFLWGYVLLLCVPIVALSVYQFLQPPTAWINKYVQATTNVAKVESFARITGTFPYIGSFTPYLQFNAVLGASIVLAGLQWSRRRLSILGSILLGGTAIVLPMTGSRSPVVIVVGGLAALFLVMRSRGQWLRFLAVAVLAGIVVSQSFGDSIFLRGWEALAERAESTGEAESRMLGLLMGPISGLEEGGLLGYGVGTNHQVASAFISGNWEGWIGGDNRVLRIFVELGALGWLVLTAMKLSFLYIATRVVRESRRPVEFIVGGTAFCVLLSYLLLPVVYNVVSSALYWVTVGAVLGMWSIQHVSNARRAMTTMSPSSLRPR